MLQKTALLALAIACSTPAFAQQSAHVHGIASINLAIDGKELEIEFVSPAEGIVGFEYEPSTAAERKAVKDAIALLRNPDKLFSLPANAGCELHEVEAERHAEDEHDDHEHAKHEEHDEHDHDKDEHAGHDDHDEDEHAKHEDHDEHDHDAEDEGAVHSEFHAHYHFDCDGSGIKTIGLRLFETWPRIETVRVQALTPNGQTGGNIDAKDPVIRLQ